MAAVVVLAVVVLAAVVFFAAVVPVVLAAVPVLDAVDVLDAVVFCAVPEVDEVFAEEVLAVEVFADDPYDVLLELFAFREQSGELHLFANSLQRF